MVNCQVLIKNYVEQIKSLLVENEINQLKKISLDCFLGKIPFGEDDAENHLVLQPMYRYFQMIAGVDNGSYIYY